MRRLLGRVGAAGLASVASSRPAWSNGGQCVAEAEEEEEYALPKLGLRRERRVADVVYDSVIVGCGVSGTAALVAHGARGGGRSCLVLDGDADAIARCRRLGGAGVTCLRERAARVDPARKRVETAGGGSYAYGGKLLVASGGAAPVPPEGFVDGGAEALVRVLGLGESSDAAVEAEALALAARGGEVAVVGGSWQAVALAGRLARAGPRSREASGHSGSAATLVFPEQTPVGARLPKALGLKLRKRLEKRGVAVVGHSQVRYVGPSASSRRCLLYLGRVDDALKTSQAYADLVVVAGGEHVPPAEVSARDALCAPRGAQVASATKPTDLDGPPGAKRPIFVNEELAANSTILACGDAAATPCRLAAATAAAAAAATVGHRACTIANDAGVHHAEATGAAAGDHLATLDGRGAAAVVARLSPTVVADFGDALGLHVTLVGKCDATLEAHHFYGKHVNVAVYVEKSASTDDGGPSRRAPVGVVFWASGPAVDAEACGRAAAAARDALAVLADAPAPYDDEHPDRLWELDLENLRTLLDECLAASGTDERTFRHAHVISRADRLGPRFYDGLGAADTALFSRGKNSKMADRVSRAYASGVVHGPGDAAPRSFAPRGRGDDDAAEDDWVALAARRAPSVSLAAARRRQTKKLAARNLTP